MEKIATPQELQDAIALKVFYNDETALSDILNHYAPSIMGVLINKYKGQFNEQDIEDIVSIAIEKFWDNRKSYDDKKGTIKAFLYVIAHNTAKDILKLGWHQAKEKEVVIEKKDLEQSFKEYLEQSFIDERHLNQIDSGNDNNELSDQMIKAIHQVLDELPDIQKKILLSDAMAGDEVSSPELGKRLGGIPANTIRVYRNRAKNAFRQGMIKYGFNI
jgi:RNA polymerase sigma factor (sigma-70 family)